MKRIFIIMVVFLLIWQPGCGRKALIRKYYVIEAQNDSHFDFQVEPLPVSVDVRDFYVSKAFEQARIAVRMESHELDYYFYHYWAVRPSAAIADIIHNLLVRENLFRNCRRGHTLNPDYVITGQIYALERIENRNQKAAHLSGIIEMIEVKTENPVVRYEFDQVQELLEDQSMNGFARYLSNIIMDVTRTFLYRTVDYFAQQKTVQ